jgi:3-oxoacyl-(acyl-carrier-protein) synthase
VSPSIVITGVGLVTCLGLSAEETWQGVLARKRAMGPMPALESPLPPGRTGGQAPDLPPDFCPGQPREVRYLRWAIEQAMKNCGLWFGGWGV